MGSQSTGGFQPFILVNRGSNSQTYPSLPIVPQGWCHKNLDQGTASSPGLKYTSIHSQGPNTVSQSNAGFISTIPNTGCFQEIILAIVHPLLCPINISLLHTDSAIFEARL